MNLKGARAAVKAEKVAGNFSIEQKKVYAAANTITRKDMSSSIGGLSNFDTINRFRYYQQLSKATPHVSTSLNKLGLSLVKGLKFEGKKQLVKDFELWAKKQNFIEQAATLARLLCRDGVYISLPYGKTPETFRLYPFFMPKTSILPEGLEPGKASKDILQPPIAQIALNEGEKTQVLYKPEQLIYGTINAWDAVQEDIKSRETFGLYGSSLIDPIELPIRNLLNVNAGYVSFVKKYGMGRYLFDFKLLENLVEKEIITFDQAQESIDAFSEQHKYLSENEDITSFGLDVIPIDAKGSLEVQAFKDSLECDIQIGLMQSPLTMGKTAGSTYASGYVSEEDRLLVLEGYQKIAENLVNDAINKRLELMGKPADSVYVTFEELSRIKLDANQVQEMYNTGVLSKQQFQNWAGFQVTEETGTGE